jgi:group I intron endonuclease
MASGIYRITCLPTQDFYIGASTNIEQRKVHHEASLRSGYCHSKVLSFLSRKYGFSAFQFEVLQYCDTSVLEVTEHQFISDLKPNLNGRKPNGFTPMGKPRWSNPLSTSYHLNVDGIFAGSSRFESPQEWKNSEWAKTNKIRIRDSVNRVNTYETLKAIDLILDSSPEKLAEILELLTKEKQ